MSIPFTNKINEQTVTPVVNESHTIGIVGTITYAPGLIRLIQVPQGPGPAVTIPGYTEILIGSPTGTQFLVDYTTGVITFNTSHDGNSILVTSYQGLGSEIAAEDINELQNPVSAIIVQNTVYNWPAAPTVSWALVPNVVFDSNVAAGAAISLSKLQSLGSSVVPITNGSGTLISSSITATELSYLDATSSIQTQLNGKQPIGNYITALTGDVSATGPNSVAAIVNSVGGSSAVNIHTAELLANAATNLDIPSTIVKRNGSGSFAISSIIFDDSGSNTLTLSAPSAFTSSYNLVWPLLQGTSATFLQNDGSGNLSWVSGSGTTYTAGSGLALIGTQFSILAPVSIVNGGTNNSITYTTGSIIFSNGTSLTQDNSNLFWNDSTHQLGIGTNTPNASAVLDLTSTTLGFLPPRMTSTQRTAISSPAEGLIVYDLTSHQAMLWNGSAWAILG